MIKRSLLNNAGTDHTPLREKTISIIPRGKDVSMINLLPMYAI